MVKKTAKALVLFSGGLDSRLAVKLLQEQGIKVVGIFFVLPFGGGCCNDRFCAFKFSQEQGFKLYIVDCSKGRNFQEYLAIIRKPKYPRGTGMNPCIDCRVFMLKKAKQLAKKLNADFIATGEVLGERPLSQNMKALRIVEKEAGLEGKLLRPLSAKLLPPTEAEKQGLVEREKLLDIKGRQRKKQIELAKRYRIDFPNPAGGCLLCDKAFSLRLADLFEHRKKITPRDIELLKIGRHFRVHGKIVLGRNKQENDMLEMLKGDNILIVPEKPGPSALVKDKRDVEIAKEMIAAYSKYGKGREKFDKYRIDLVAETKNKGKGERER